MILQVAEILSHQMKGWPLVKPFKTKESTAFLWRPRHWQDDCTKNIMAGVIKDEIYHELIDEKKETNPDLSYLEITAKYEDEIRRNVDEIFAERIANKDQQKL